LHSKEGGREGGREGGKKGEKSTYFGLEGVWGDVRLRRAQQGGNDEEGGRDESREGRKAKQKYLKYDAASLTAFTGTGRVGDGLEEASVEPRTGLREKGREGGGMREPEAYFLSSLPTATRFLPSSYLTSPPCFLPPSLLPLSISPYP